MPPVANCVATAKRSKQRTGRRALSLPTSDRAVLLLRVMDLAKDPACRTCSHVHYAKVFSQKIDVPRQSRRASYCDCNSPPRCTIVISGTRCRDASPHVGWPTLFYRQFFHRVQNFRNKALQRIVSAGAVVIGQRKAVPISHLTSILP